MTLAAERVEDFFAVRFARVDGAVAELFSWKGKWRATFWSREEYERHVRRTLERKLMRPSDFERDVLARVREDFAYSLGAAENRMLAEVHAFARVDAPSLAFEPFAARYAALVADLLPAVSGDTAMNVTAFVGSEAVAVGVSAGFAAAGLFAANSWWNFGIGLVVGVVAAVVVDAIVGDVCEDEIRTRVHCELVRLRREAVDRVVGAVGAAWAEHAKRQEDAVAKAVEASL